MTKSIPRLLIFLGLSSRASSAGFSGSPKCPCTSTAVSTSTAESIVCAEGLQCFYDAEALPPRGLGPAESFTLLTSSEAVVLNRSYGADLCLPHDQGLGEDCGQAAVKYTSSGSSLYCAEAWCYVDPRNCSVGYFQAVYEPGAYFSYETCGGDVAPWRESAISRRVLNGAVLTTSVPQSAKPMHYIVGPDGKPILGAFPPNEDLNALYRAGRFKGAMVDFLSELAEEGDFAINWRPTTQGNLVRFPESAYTACVHDVGDGIADLCFSDVWSTQERTEIAPLTTPIEIDTFHLFVPRGEKAEDSLKDRIRTPFKPFETTLWIAIVLAVAVTASVNALIAAQLDENNGTANRAGAAPGAAFCKSINLVKEIYLSLMASMRASPIKAGDGTAEQRLSNLAFGFLILVLSCSYTANLTAILSEPEQFTMTITSIEDCAAKKCTLCTMDVYHDYVDLLYGNSGVRPLNTYQNLVALPDTSGWNDVEVFFRSLTKGDCDGAVISESSYRYLDIDNKFDSAQLGNFQYVGKSLFSYPIAAPVAQKYLAAFSYHVRSAVEQGKWEDFLLKATGPRRTDPYAASADPPSTRKKPLKLATFYGPFLVSAATIVASLLLHLVKRQPPPPLDALASSITRRSISKIISRADDGGAKSTTLLDTPEPQSSI